MEKEFTIDSWNIEMNIELLEDYLNNQKFFNMNVKKTFCLDLNEEKYSFIEKMVYDTVKFHFKRLNLELTENYTIEFWVKQYPIVNNMHLDIYQCNEPFNLVPKFTCLTYLNDSEYPTVITNIDESCIKDNNPPSKNIICFSFAKQLKHILFEGGKYYHGVCKVFENVKKNHRNVLAINIYDENINGKIYFKKSLCDYRFDVNKNNDMLTFNRNNKSEYKIIENVDIDILNYKYLRGLVFSKEINLLFNKTFLRFSYMLTSNLSDKQYDIFILENINYIKNNRDRIKF